MIIIFLCNSVIAFDAAQAGVELIVRQRSRGKAYPPELLELFNELDLDKGGTLGEFELKFALNRFGLPAIDEYVQEILRQVSSNICPLRREAEFHIAKQLGPRLRI